MGYLGLFDDRNVGNKFIQHIVGPNERRYEIIHRMKDKMDQYCSGRNVELHHIVLPKLVYCHYGYYPASEFMQNYLPNKNNLKWRRWRIIGYWRFNIIHFKEDNAMIVLCCEGIDI